MRKLTIPFIALLLGFSLNTKVFAHCEVPCGIYNDELRIALLYEHFTTIEKAMTQIEELSKADNINFNQIVRWTTTKEDHANEIQHIATQYFITQRVKLPATMEGPEYEKYVKELSALHAVIVYAMKAKQTTDVKNVEKLRESLTAFEAVYFEGEHRHKIEDAH
ncbi:MAG: superoxide dismutase, Ni [Bacteroidales bacterium]|nr:superoxide dismutase, Ni [Bacteroidales bacterium]MCF8402459.1 superoxide dismutase, Ni [Bacteroidales bacterium]